MSEPKWSTVPWIVDIERGGELPEDDIRIRTADWEIAWVKEDCGELQNQSETRANAYLISAAPDLYETLHSEALFLRRFLEQLVHVPVKDERGYIVNGFAAEQIPDWEIRQRLDDIEAALAKARGEESCQVVNDKR